MKEYNGFIELTEEEFENKKNLKDSDYFHARHIENAEICWIGDGKVYIYVRKNNS